MVNLDPHYTQAGFVTLPLDELEIPQDRAYEAEDLLSGERYLWQGTRNYVELNPSQRAGHILKIHRSMKGGNRLRVLPLDFRNSFQQLSQMTQPMRPPRKSFRIEASALSSKAS